MKEGRERREGDREEREGVEGGREPRHHIIKRVERVDRVCGCEKEKR